MEAMENVSFWVMSAGRHSACAPTL
jgi:hypothetical protein